MQSPGRFSLRYGVPVVLSAATFCTLNLLWNLPGTSEYAGRLAYQPVAVYLVGGSGLAVALLWGTARAGRVTRGDLGLDPSGWTPPRRLGSLAVILLLAYAACVTTVSPDGTRRPTLEEFCYWSVIVLSASLAELLVFLGVGFCLTRRGLLTGGVRPAWATLSAAAVASVAFGLYHYTYEPRWWPYVYPLMGEMVVVVLFFLATRNFYLTLAFHNLMATIGFLGEQYSPNPQDAAYFSERGAFTANVVSFLVPFALLHLLEWKGWPPAPAVAENTAGS